MKGFFSGVKKISEKNEENSDDNADSNKHSVEESSAPSWDNQENNTSPESEPNADTNDEEQLTTNTVSDETTADSSDAVASDTLDQPVIPEAIDGPRYSIGIDLGTTHCVLSYVDISDPDADEIVQQVLEIPQLTAPGVIEDKAQLPSFLYQAHEAEISEGETALPWTAEPEFLVGEIARNLGSKTPIRLVSSAKSWLCHAGVDCKSAILPSEAPEEVERVSPFQASKAYLQHLCAAWNKKFPHDPIEDQEITLTVPASFDPAARELTAEAAQSAGLGSTILLEEPQAALYSWIEKSDGDWRNHANVGDIILVIDVGGGTTDLSLIAVTQENGNLGLTRIAVGDHILLGGDNMDLALAYTLKAKLEKEQKVREEKARKLKEEKRIKQEKLAAEKKRKLEEQQRRAEEAAEFQRALREEEIAREQAARAVRLQTQREQYIMLIKQKVNNNWLRPATTATGQSCDVSVTQTMRGDVIDVQLQSCTADNAFQRSVERAVRKASPLPPPPDPELFDRQIDFTFKPR